MLRTFSILLLCLTTALAGCAAFKEPSWAPEVEYTGATAGPETTATIQSPWDVKYYRSDQPLRLAVEYFYRGNYGIASQYYREAAEKAPKDPVAWLGLAASYDRLARFDLADQAYRRALKFCGETPELLNNMGYSYMLRGKLRAAYAKFKHSFCK